MNAWVKTACQPGAGFARVHIIAASLGGIRLIKGTAASPTEGRLEVKLGPWWGAVCSTGFGNKEAKVVCRMKGKTYGKAAHTSYSSSTTLGVLMSDVVCTGAETSLAQCRFNRTGRFCAHASVFCYSELLGTEHRSIFTVVLPGFLIWAFPGCMDLSKNADSTNYAMLHHGDWNSPGIHKSSDCHAPTNPADVSDTCSLTRNGTVYAGQRDITGQCVFPGEHS